MSGFFGSGSGSGSGVGSGSGSVAGADSAADFFVLRVAFFVLRAGFLAAGSAACSTAAGFSSALDR